MQGLLPIADDVRNTGGRVTENRHGTTVMRTERKSHRDTGVSSTPFLLVVDDSPTVRKILEVCLKREGYHVHSFRDGIEMLSWFKTPEACIPHLIVLDINLPTIDGYTLMRHLKAKPAFAGTVFIILTGRCGMLDRLKGRLCGAQVYLTKPFRTDDILAVVHTYLGPMQMQEITEDMKVMASQ